VGYGLDFAERYRNLPFVGVLYPHVYKLACKRVSMATATIKPGINQPSQMNSPPPHPLFCIPIMQVLVHFYSYFKDLTGCAETVQNVPDGSTIGDLLRELVTRFPKLAACRIRRSSPSAEYQDRACVLKPGDEVSLFPPVQGG